jgi:murein DD-endopeptidase MepM/ murein hydrolase activator NlpD
MGHPRIARNRGDGRLTRRTRLAALVMALVAVSWLLVGTQPTSVTLAGDPLSDAKAKQQQLEHELATQRAQLASLRSTATQLSNALALAKSKLASVTAQYQQVSTLVDAVTSQVNELKAQLETLKNQIAQLDAQLQQVADEITVQTAELQSRESLLQDHLRAAYEQSQTSLLEVLLSARSLDDATNQVGYLLTVSDQDKALADEIRSIRAQLAIKQQELTDGRAALADAQAQATDQETKLSAQQAELTTLQKQLATLKKQWERQKAEQEAKLNASLAAQANLKASIAKVQAAASAQASLVKKLQAEQAAASLVGPGGFIWPEYPTTITQYYGPTTFSLEPSYGGYAHFHTGLDMARGCGTPIKAAANGIVAASGQPLYPYDYAYGVIINHGGGLQTWYWHMQPRVIVHPGQTVARGQVIGYEGATGFATGCHLHFAVNVNGAWRNPLAYLP